MFWFVFIWIICMIIGICSLVFLVIVFMQDYKRKNEKKKRMLKVNCIKKTKGIVIYLEDHMMTIEFKHHGRTYSFKEKVDQQINRGEHVNIKYNPHNPKEAYKE